MPYLTEYITGGVVALALHSGFDSGCNTPPSSLPIIRDRLPVSPAVATNSKINTRHQVQPGRLAHLALITSLANQDTTTNRSWHLAHLTQHYMFTVSPGATPRCQGSTWRNTRASELRLVQSYIFRAQLRQFGQGSSI